MSDNQKRMDRIAKALTPKQAVLAWIAEAQFESVHDYAKRLTKETFSNHPLKRLADQIAEGLKDSLKGKPERTVNEAVLKSVREVAFLFFLRLHLERRVLEDIAAPRLTGVGLIDLMRAMIENDLMRDQHKQVVDYLSEVAYPLHTADAAAVRAASRNRLMTFSQMEGRRIGFFGAERAMARREGRAIEANPVVEWVRAHFARQGRQILPQEAYVGRERGELDKDWPETRIRMGPTPKELLKLFGNARAYGAFGSCRDFSFGLADVPDREFMQVLETVLKALHELVSSGTVKEAREVFLSSVPPVFLRRAPLIDREWVDRHLVELAEFGAMLAEQGFTQAEDGDRHSLAWPSICAPKESAIGEDGIREQAAKHVSDFGGRTIMIDGRQYLNVVDYERWSERRFKAELKYEDGFSIDSFNRWTERSDPSELAEIRVEPIYQSVSESDFVVYPEVEDAVDAQERRREIIDELAARDGNQGGVAEWRKLFRAYATDVLRVRVLVEFVQQHYFDGHDILWKGSMAQLEEAVRMLDELAIGFDNQIAFRAALSPADSSPRSEIQAIKKSIEPRAIAKSLVNEAKTDALNLIGHKEAALDLLVAELREIAG